MPAIPFHFSGEKACVSLCYAPSKWPLWQSFVRLQIIEVLRVAPCLGII